MIQVMVMDQLVGRGLIPQNRRFDSYRHYFPEPELGGNHSGNDDGPVGRSWAYPPKIAGSIPAVIIPRRHNCKRQLEVTAVLAVRAASIPKTTRVLGMICVASGGFFRHTSVSVAQLGEHLTFNQDVAGSNPVGNIVKKKHKRR